MRRSINSKRYIILAILFVAWFLGYCDKVAINVAAIPISKEYGLNPTQIGIIISSFSFGLAIMTLFGGYAADKFGSSKLLVVIIAIWSLFSGATGIAGSFMAIVILRFIYGGAEGFFPPASSVTITENFSKEEFGRAKSFLLSSGSLGTAFSTLLVAYLATSYSWRIAFYVFAVLGLADALALVIVNRGSEKKGMNLQKPKTKKVPLREAFKNPLVWQMPIIQFGAGFILWGLNSWLPQYWVNVKHLDIRIMAEYTLIPNLAAFVFVNISGWILDKFSAGREKFVVIGSLLLTCISVFLMYITNNIALGIVYQTIAFLGISFLSPALYIIVLKYVRKDLVGTATGLIGFGSSLAGIISPVLMGFSITLLKGSYLAVFGMIILILMLCILVAVKINTRKQVAENMNAQIL